MPLMLAGHENLCHIQPVLPLRTALALGALTLSRIEPLPPQCCKADCALVQIYSVEACLAGHCKQSMGMSNDPLFLSLMTSRGNL